MSGFQVSDFQVSGFGFQVSGSDVGSTGAFEGDAVHHLLELRDRHLVDPRLSGFRGSGFKFRVSGSAKHPPPVASAARAAEWASVVN